MPPEVALPIERKGRFFWILRYLLLCVYIFFALRRTATPYASVGLTLKYAIPSVVTGAILGTLFALIRTYGISLWPDLRSANVDHPESKGPIGVWMAVILMGGFAEELWRAYCIVAITNDGNGVRFAVLLTSAAFAISQLGGRPSRITSCTTEIFLTAFIGAGFGVLFLVSHSLLAVVPANIVYHGMVLRMLREQLPNRSANA